MQIAKPKAETSTAESKKTTEEIPGVEPNGNDEAQPLLQPEKVEGMANYLNWQTNPEFKKLLEAGPEQTKSLFKALVEQSKL